MNQIAQKILQRKYLRNNESFEDLCLRVANHVAQAEGENSTEWTAKYFQLIHERVFLPGGRILANSGTGIPNLLNCFVLDVEDSRESIYSTLGEAAEIFSQGGGLGIDFSTLREKGSALSTGGKASGPLLFMELFNHTGEIIQEHSRRAAQMGIMDISHPDITDFINYKSGLSDYNLRVLQEFQRYAEGLDESAFTESQIALKQVLLNNQLVHFNISVMLNDEFMEEVKNKGDWDLIAVTTGEVVETIRADVLFDYIAKQAWISGDPGVAFYDRINEDNMVPYIGDLKTSNPCGEIFLLPGEPCCLGSINLNKVIDFSGEQPSVNWEFLEYIIRTGVRFLDNIQTVSYTGIDRVDDMAKGLRRIGLGVMGWADMLAQLEIPYDSLKAMDLAEYMSWFISYFAWMESHELAKEKGTFPLYDPNKVNTNVLDRVLNSRFSMDSKHDVDNFPVRNVSVTTVAPTGSISLVGEASSSIEPFFLLAYRRNITDGVGNIEKDYVIEINPILFDKLKDYGLSEERIKEIRREVFSTGSVQDIEDIPQKLKDVFKTSHEIHWKDHVAMQASWQKYVTNSISKTINMNHESTVEDIKNAYLYMHESGLKGGTIYRSGSKIFQILNKN